MSKRAEEAAMRAYPEKMGTFYEADIHYEADLNKAARIKFIQGYEQAEKNTIERAENWIKENVIWSTKFIERFHKYMEEE